MALKLVPPGKRKYKDWSVRGTHCGRHVEESTHAKDKAAALAYLRGLEREIEAELKAGSGPVTFAYAAEQFIAFRRPRKKDERAIRALFPYIGQKPVTQIKVNDLAVAANTLLPVQTNQTKNRHVMGPAARVLHYAAENEWCPWLRIKMFKEPRAKTRGISHDAAEKLIAAAPAGPKQFMLLWLFHTGMRISDVLRLRWDDVDLARGVVKYHVGKTDRYVEKGLHPALIVYPQAAPRPEYIFPWRSGHGIYGWLRPMVRAMGIEFTPHMARHSLGKWLNESGASLRTIMDQLDHLDPVSSVRYQSTDRAMLSEAVVKAVGKKMGKAV